jgi:hypothetical protein
MYIKMECKNCLVAKYCPKNGSSPQRLENGKDITCRLVGGYGKKPVDKEILSEESKELVANNGKCLTIAEVPDVFRNDVVYNVVKVFSPPVLHERENTSYVADAIKSKNMK